jgi:hypothetical protein
MDRWHASEGWSPAKGNGAEQSLGSLKNHLCRGQSRRVVVKHG